eukprot:scaffold194635_cov26-Tisochrysis_lutea.AAC.1
MQKEGMLHQPQQECLMDEGKTCASVAEGGVALEGAKGSAKGLCIQGLRKLDRTSSVEPPGNLAELRLAPPSLTVTVT